VLAWRGDIAYAVFTVVDDVGGTRVELVRLRPGGSEPETLLTAPAEADSMNVATDYVEAVVPAGTPEFGFNKAEVAGPVVTTLVCASTFVALIVWAIVRRRRRPVYRWFDAGSG
jgi:hypothetical protein